MKRTMLVWLLKMVLVICTLGVLLAAGLLLPTYMRHVVEVRAELSGWYGWIIAYGWLLSIPALLSIALMWRVFTTINGNDAFCQQNALRFAWIWRFAVIDLALVAAMGLFLLINQATPLFLVVTILGLFFLGAAAGLTAVALSGLIKSAASFKQDSDMTI